MNRNQHSDEFREQALSKVRQRGTRSVRDIAEELNMSAATLRTWWARSNHAMLEATPTAELPSALAVETSFAEVIGLIEQARQRAYQAVNSELVGLYWRIGEYISAKLTAAVWGEGGVDRLAQHLARTMPGQRGFTRRNLFRMRQLFEAYSTADQTSDGAAGTTAVDP